MGRVPITTRRYRAIQAQLPQQYDGSGARGLPRPAIMPPSTASDAPMNIGCLVRANSTLSQSAIFARRNTDLPAEDSSEMAWATVTNIEPDLDRAPVSLPQQTASLFES
jgi:hypothetical protein